MNSWGSGNWRWHHPYEFRGFGDCMGGAAAGVCAHTCLYAGVGGQNSHAFIGFGDWGGGSIPMNSGFGDWGKSPYEFIGFWDWEGSSSINS